jgi:hypothetical protein
LEHKIAKWEKKYGFIGWTKKTEHEFLEFFPEHEFTLVAFGEHLSNRKLDLKYKRLFVGKTLKDNPEVVEGSIVVFKKISPNEYRMDLKTGVVVVPPTPPTPIHGKTIHKWGEEQKKMFGVLLTPIILNNVNLNEILPKSIHLKENTKTVDAFAVLKIGERPIYRSVLEVQHKGVREDTVVRVALILPFVDHVDIVAEIDDLLKMKELLERLVDPNVVKTRVSFHTFTEYLKLK